MSNWILRTNEVDNWRSVGNEASLGRLSDNGLEFDTAHLHEVELICELESLEDVIENLVARYLDWTKSPKNAPLKFNDDDKQLLSYSSVKDVVDGLTRRLQSFFRSEGCQFPPETIQLLTSLVLPQVFQTLLERERPSILVMNIEAFVENNWEKIWTGIDPTIFLEYESKQWLIEVALPEWFVGKNILFSDTEDDLPPFTKGYIANQLIEIGPPAMKYKKLYEYVFNNNNPGWGVFTSFGALKDLENQVVDLAWGDEGTYVFLGSGHLTFNDNKWMVQTSHALWSFSDNEVEVSNTSNTIVLLFLDELN